jgi:hypothetical protein
VTERYSPDAALGWLRQHGHLSIVNICIKMLNLYFDCELSVGVSNKDMPDKRIERKRHKTIHRKTYTNLKG